MEIVTDLWGDGVDGELIRKAMMKKGIFTPAVELGFNFMPTLKVYSIFGIIDTLQLPSTIEAAAEEVYRACLACKVSCYNYYKTSIMS